LKPIHIVVDVEADGPCPGMFSMVSFAAVPVFGGDAFKALVRPISNRWVPEALAVSRITRHEHEGYPHPMQEMKRFVSWLEALGGRPVFWSDNPAFDWQFVNYYLHAFTESGNPFGHSARRIGDLYAGHVGRLPAHTEWKRFRKTPHTHDPVDDARGNAEALAIIIERLVPRPESKSQERRFVEQGINFEGGERGKYVEFGRKLPRSQAR